MNSSRLPLPRLLLFIFAAFIAGTGQAQARRGLKLWTVGETVSVIGPATPEELKNYGTPSVGFNKVGFKYDYAGLFWLDLWNWGGEYCLTDGDTVLLPALSKEEAAALLGKSPGDLGKPLNYRFPLGLDILVVLGFLKIMPRFLAKRKAARETNQFNSAPAWTPPPSRETPDYAPPQAPPAGGPPPVPPPLPPEQQ